MLVRLTAEQEEFAVSVGKRRHACHRDAARPDPVVRPNTGPLIDEQGACAELAVAFGLGVAWDGQYLPLEKWERWRLCGTDVSGVEVRSTTHATGSLILHPKDKDEAPFVLVTCPERPLYRLVGWCWGREGKRPSLWRDVGYGRPCYYVKQRLLRPLAELRAALRGSSGLPTAPKNDSPWLSSSP